ncbi:unnamed protein product [Brachionus calyciflorus]|uniref:HAT C-terminal dimerisation domain-containing protein n=1 Tax=Brachionus calyciflorus TaxID=104777 RepID=A0A814RBN2_9BILA|nr:unnamed protein product [Brachionus calyciflorus]
MITNFNHQIILIWWSSSFLLLESFHKAIARNAFPPNDPCPVNLVNIETYLQILAPAFHFNLIMQKSKSTIADVLPTLIITISKWNRMELTGNYRKLADNLISAFKFKFRDEIKSSLYCVASLLNISKLKIWIKRPDCADIKKNGLDNLTKIAKIYLEKRQKKTLNSDDLNRTQTSTSTMDSITAFEMDDDYLSETEVSKVIDNYELERQKIYFIKNVIDNSRLNANSTAKFWSEDNQMSHFSNLALSLLNIPSSSSYIERFYSICGTVCKKNSGNMTAGTIIQRSLLSQILSF